MPQLFKRPKPRKIKAMLPCRDPLLPCFNGRWGGVSSFKVHPVSRELGKRGGRASRGKVWQIDAVWPRARTEMSMPRKGQWGSALFEGF